MTIIILLYGRFFYQYIVFPLKLQENKYLNFIVPCMFYRFLVGISWYWMKIVKVVLRNLHSSKKTIKENV